MGIRRNMEGFVWYNATRSNNLWKCIKSPVAVKCESISDLLFCSASRIVSVTSEVVISLPILYASIMRSNK